MNCLNISLAAIAAMAAIIKFFDKMTSLMGYLSSDPEQHCLTLPKLDDLIHPQPLTLLLLI